MIKERDPRSRSIDEIIDAVEGALLLPAGSVRDSQWRTREVSLARHVAFYVARRETKLSFTVIAQCFGLSDHKAVIYGFNRVSVAVRAGGEDAPTIYRTLKKVAPEVLP